MSEREPITAELRAALDVDREFMRADGTVVAQTFCVDRGDFERLCDAIDAVHAGLERENAELRQRVAVLDNERGNMHETDAWKLGYDEGFASADDWLADNEDAMEEHGWIRLPLDADGVPIRVGDEMVDELDESTAPRKVTSLYLANDGWWVYIGCVGRRPDRYSHHHDPTVEDVLTKFGIDWEYESDCEDRAALLAEYAAKLRLAGDAE